MKRFFAVLLATAALYFVVPIESGVAQIIPCDATCVPGDPPDPPGCSTHYDWVCSSCGVAPICEWIPSLCTTPNPGRVGTKIKHTVCTGGGNTEEWSNAPCGYCNG